MSQLRYYQFATLKVQRDKKTVVDLDVARAVRQRDRAMSCCIVVHASLSSPPIAFETPAKQASDSQTGTNFVPAIHRNMACQVVPF